MPQMYAELSVVIRVNIPVAYLSVRIDAITGPSDASAPAPYDSTRRLASPDICFGDLVR